MSATGGTGATIAELTGGKAGDLVTIFDRLGGIVVKGGGDTTKIRLEGAVDFTMGSRATVTLMKLPDNDGGWAEIGGTT